MGGKQQNNASAAGPRLEFGAPKPGFVETIW